MGEPEGQAVFQRLRLGSVINTSFAPQLEAQLRRDVQLLFARRPGAVRLEEPAQALIEITLTDYSRKASVKQERDGLIPRAFTLQATAQLNLKPIGAQAGKGFSKPKTISASIELARDTQALQAEYQSIPQLSLELAIKIHKALTEIW